MADTSKKMETVISKLLRTGTFQSYIKISNLFESAEKKTCKIDKKSFEV